MDSILTRSFGESEPWKNRAYFFICIIDITGREVMHDWIMHTNCSHFNPNWHEGDTFISLSFWDLILSAEFWSKLFKVLGGES